MHIAVAIASKGRPQILGECLTSLGGQRRQPDSVWVGVPGKEDLPAERSAVPTNVVLSPAGLTKQRNALVDAMGDDVDLIVYIDDDTELHPGFLERAEQLASDRPEVILFSGLVVADGVRTGPIERSAARVQLARRIPGDGSKNVRHVYGCCMVVRADTARMLRFDERLPLYGWLEDRDFSSRAARVGRVIEHAGCEFIHLGVPSGRQSGLRLGFQQVVHPVYLRRRRVLTLTQTLYLIARPLLGNILGLSLGWRRGVDRRGRLQGNLTGFRSILSGGPRPEEVLRLP